MGICWSSKTDQTIKPIEKNRRQNDLSQELDNNNNNNELNNEFNEENKENEENKKFNNSIDESINEFPDFPIYSEDIKQGLGIKEMLGYKCDLRIDELNKKREEFWTSRKKNKIIWHIIHQACIFDHIKAEEHLASNDIKTLCGCINMCVDKEGNIYRVPNYCINDPYFSLEVLPNDESHNNLIEIILYDIAGQKKTKLKIRENTTGKEIIEKFAQEHNIDLNTNKIRLLFGGGIISENDTLYQHKVKTGFSIQICVTKIL